MFFDKEIKSVLQLIKEFPDEQSCIDFLESVRWEDGVTSPFDSASKVYKSKDNKYICKNTNKYFNVKTGTIFDNTKLPLQKWFLAIWIVTAHKKGISSLQLGRDLNITQKSAWFMLHRIRKCFGLDLDDKMDGIIEVDETYIGGDNKNKSKTKRKLLHKDGAQTGAKHKKPVVGLLERDGDVKAFVIEGKANGKSIKPLLNDTISPAAIVVTDGFGAYAGIDKTFSGHHIVNHAKDEYVRGIYHTNGVEGFWSHLNRMIYGIYHSTSVKHLQKYVDEMAYRYNNRKTTDNARFNLFFSNMDNRLTYKQLING